MAPRLLPPLLPLLAATALPACSMDDGSSSGDADGSAAFADGSGPPSSSTRDAMAPTPKDAATGSPMGGAGNVSDGGWLATCQQCAEGTGACTDEDCLRCIFAEPPFSGDGCAQSGFWIESLGILRAECTDACR